MKINNMDERIKKIADNYGLFSQMWQTAEECSELIQALNKYQRAARIVENVNMDERETIHNICEEIADVTIMLEQLRYLFDIDDDFKVMYEKKIQRTIDRMKRCNRM